MLRDKAMGTHAVALAGGGVAVSTGADALFINPGAMRIPTGQQVETGLLGFSNGIAPYALFGSAAGGATFALGYVFDSREMAGTPTGSGRGIPGRQGMAGGAAMDVVPWMSLGAAARGREDNGSLGVDVDLGILARPADWAALGLTAGNLMESGIGLEPQGYRTHRRYALGLAARAPGFALGRLRTPEADASYELQAEGFSPDALVQVVSLATSLPPGRTLGARGSLRLPPGGDMGWAVGLFVDIPLGGHALRFGYAIDSGDPEAVTDGAAAEIGHSLSLALHWGGRADRTPPEVSVRADRVLMNAADTGGADRVHFRIAAGDGVANKKPAGPGRVQTWSLVICATQLDGRAGKTVRSFQGQDLPPRLIRWEGLDEAGQPLAPGYYAFRFSARDKAGNLGETAWQWVEIGAPRKRQEPGRVLEKTMDSLDLEL